jgi:hypothetical protein
MISPKIFIILFLFFSYSNSKEDVLLEGNKFYSKLYESQFESINENITLKSLFDTDECLAEKSELKNLGIKSPTESQRFIHGKCNPVLVVPGIFCSKLITTVNCQGLSQNEPKTFKELRVFCGDSVCYNPDSTYEEYNLFISLLNGPFDIVSTGPDKYAACLGFFMQFYNNEEYPSAKQSPYIKIYPYGMTDESKENSKCGLEGVRNVIMGPGGIADELANQGAAKGYSDIIKSLKKMGYEEGFSLMGLPYDYRRFLSTNNYIINSFQYQINKLYENTGKPVVLITHSFGTLLGLNNLLRDDNKDLVKKIKKFIAIAPPFSGADKLLDVFLKGHHEWDFSFDLFGNQIKVTDFDLFGQQLMFSSMPMLFELRPLSGITNYLNNNIDFKEAILERLNLEKNCFDKNCDESYVKENSVKFNNIFNSYFPDLNDAECKYDDTPKKDDSVWYNQCRSQLFDIIECPMILNKTKDFNPIDIESYCNQKSPNIFYDNVCSSDSNCLDNIYSKEVPYPFDDKEKTQFLIDRFNEDYEDEYDSIDKSFFEPLDSIKKRIETIINKYNEISKTKDLPIPPIDTDIIYGNFQKTAASFIYDTNKKEQFSRDEKLFKGGDGTVPNWSSLLTGFKWIYEKKKNNLNQNINLIEYCSLLGKSGKYVFDNEKGILNGHFAALDCECLNKKNIYNEVKKCAHAPMISDETLIDYLKYEVYGKNDDNMWNDSKTKALNNFKDINFVDECNNELYKIAHNEK